MAKPTVHSTSIVHQNPWYRVRRDELQWPNGKPGQYFVAEFPPVVGVVSVRNEKLLVIRQYRHTIGHRTMEFVKGRTEPNEHPSDAAHREFEEEAGWKAEKMIPLGTINSLIGAAQLTMHVFLADELTETRQHLDDGESGLQVQWVPIKAWRAMIRCGQIRDAESLACWSLYREMEA